MRSYKDVDVCVRIYDAKPFARLYAYACEAGDIRVIGVTSAAFALGG